MAVGAECIPAQLWAPCEAFAADRRALDLCRSCSYPESMHSPEALKEHTW